MKKKLTIISLLIAGAIIGCKKFHDMKSVDPLSDPSYLYGRLFLTDTKTLNASNVPLAGKTVTVMFSEDTDLNNFRFSAITDANGYFKFPTLNRKRSYRLYYKETSSGKLYVADTTNIKLPQETLQFNAGLSMTDQTGIIYSVKDKKGSPLGNVTVCTSLSAIPNDNNTCDGSLFSSISDASGHASGFGLAPGNYYAFAKTTVNGTSYVGKITFTVTSKVEERTITIDLPPITSPSNGLTVTLRDENGALINGGRVCLFTSKILAARDTCEGSTYSFTTNISGAGTVTNVTPGFYYILGDASFKNFKYLARDTVTITNAVRTRTLTLKH